MPFPIHIITSESDLLNDIATSILPLNTVQKEFIFQIADLDQQKKGFDFKREAYTNDEIHQWLSDYRSKQGYCPFVILVISKPLSGKLANLFGSKSNDGLAWFTTETFERGTGQFIFDRIRFCRYYFTRYVLSFVNQDIASHQTNTCMFDNKISKRDLLLSYSTGKLCDNCRRQLSSSPNYTVAVGAAIDKLLHVVSNQMPLALVMKGGGVKGLALVGALKELEKYFSFNTFAGTSAGAIAAALLAAGYSPSELEHILREKEFSEFKNGFFTRFWNGITKNGLHSGKHFREWIDELIVEKLPNQVSNVKMKDLPHRAILYASWSRGETLKFDSKGTRNETDVAFATRCSMSIPLFFTPVELEGKKVYDGGLGNNFPLRRFMADNNQSLFIGLYLKPEKSADKIKSDLIDIVTDSDEREIVDANLDRIVIIDPSPIKTTQFSLTDYQKEFLLSAGKVGALEYLLKHHQDINVDLASLSKEKEKVKRMRKNITDANKKDIDAHQTELGISK
ncbi:patatin-like phospholipase family protein [Pedobacter chitinilyticus]|uniref:PNPLA domain-containing protein n=1 Tax=Pedobacter chitinilyticus TaxID=2233776 RepID=A0A3S3QG04_9SPHI|nr:patatin-like phospholipase family protein [Pedobacter chitinilyticus]RWU08119.1 hypothetical protein DPV69_06990 [Pedobacter chitinilyticus]